MLAHVTKHIGRLRPFFFYKTDLVIQTTTPAVIIGNINIAGWRNHRLRMWLQDLSTSNVITGARECAIEFHYVHIVPKFDRIPHWVCIQWYPNYAAWECRVARARLWGQTLYLVWRPCPRQLWKYDLDFDAADDVNVRTKDEYREVAIARSET